MICNKCGKELPQGAMMCTSCGNMLNQVPSQNDNSNKKGFDSKVLIIVVLVLIVIALSVVLILSFGKKGNENNNGNNNDNTSTQVLETTVTTVIETKDDKNYASKIDVDSLTFKSESNDERSKNVKLIKVFGRDITYGGKILNILLENNNDEMIEGTVYLNYYKNGIRINSNIGFASFIKPHSKFSITITPSIKEDFDTVDLTYKSSMKSSSYIDVPVDNSKIKVTDISNDLNKKLEVSYTNDYSKDVTYYFAIVYKKNGEYVGCDSTIVTDVRPGKTFDEEISLYYAPSDYDDYEVFIQSAYSKEDSY